MIVGVQDSQTRFHAPASHLVIHLSRRTNTLQHPILHTTLRYGSNILCCSTRTLHSILILGQPNRGVDKMGDRPITSGTHLWNVMVLAERLEFRVKLVDAILVRLSCQFLHLIGELYGAHEYKVVLHRANTRTRFRWASEKRFSAAVFRSSLVLAMAGEFLPLPEGEALADSSSLVAPFATLAFFFLR